MEGRKARGAQDRQLFPAGQTGRPDAIGIIGIARLCREAEREREIEGEREREKRGQSEDSEAFANLNSYLQPKSRTSEVLGTFHPRAEDSRRASSTGGLMGDARGEGGEMGMSRNPLGR